MPAVFSGIRQMRKAPEGGWKVDTEFLDEKRKPFAISFLIDQASRPDGNQVRARAEEFLTARQAVLEGAELAAESPPPPEPDPVVPELQPAPSFLAAPPERLSAPYSPPKASDPQDRDYVLYAVLVAILLVAGLIAYYLQAGHP